MDPDAAIEAAASAACGGLDRPGRVLVLTGAGVSAASGIPTFRGKEGYWTVGATEYHPQELATARAFGHMPWEVWAWYLYRREVCRRAAPNAAHHTVARAAFAPGLGSRFALITQNVDGLHRRAGSPDRSSFAIHGDISLMRCAADCVLDRWPIPEAVAGVARGAAVPASARALLACPRCGGMARPHVLWFDESYDEPRFHLDTVRALARDAAVLVIAGTSAQTNLPWQVVELAGRAGAVIVDINPEPNPFAEIAAGSGGAIAAPAAAALPALVEYLASHALRSEPIRAG